MQAAIAESLNMPVQSMTQLTFGRDYNIADVSHLEEEKINANDIIEDYKWQGTTQFDRPPWMLLIDKLGMTLEEYEKEQAVRCPICFTVDPKDDLVQCQKCKGLMHKVCIARSKNTIVKLINTYKNKEKKLRTFENHK